MSTKAFAAYLQGTGIGIAAGMGATTYELTVYVVGALALGFMTAGYYFDKKSEKTEQEDENDGR